MKDAYFFSHDSNARNDIKILELRAQYSWEGYGIYWAIVENLRDANTDNYKLPIKKLAGLAISLNLEKEWLKTFIDFCIELDLFEQSETHFWSDSLNQRMVLREEKRARRQEAGRRGAEVRWGEDSKAIGNATPENTKGKESKVKEKKEKGETEGHLAQMLVNHIRDYCPSVGAMKNNLTYAEAEKLIEKFGYDNVIGVLDSMENFTGLKKYKSTYLTCNNWLKRNGAINPKTSKRNMIY